jgi:UDP-N-acetylglucosamine acyltransferase
MSDRKISVHSTASVHPRARLDPGVKIGPFAVVGEDVTIHEDTVIDAHVCLSGKTEIGKGCRFSPFSAIGGEPQDISYKGEDTCVKIGEGNIFREFMTVHRGTVSGRGETVIGDGNYFMAYSHIAHDCIVGSNTVFLHGATIGGHVVIEDFSTVGALSGVHQFCRIGKYAFIGGSTVITQDVLPFCRVAGARPTLFYGLNAIGLRRHGFSRERIKALKEMFKIVFYSDLNSAQALERVEKEFPPGKDRDDILRFFRESRRGIVKKPSDKWDKNWE